MSDTYTSNYNLVKPAPGQSQDTWGTKLNTNFDAVDGQMKGNSNAAAAAQSTADAAMPKGGGTFTGAVTLAGPPTADLHPATRKWVADALDLLLPKSGGTLTGPLRLAGAPTDATHATTKAYVDQQIAANSGTGGVSQSYVDQGDANSRLYTDVAVSTIMSQIPSTQNFMTKAGDTMTGFLTLVGNPQQPNHAANKQYVDNLQAAVAATFNSFMPTAGGTFSGPVSLSAGPTQPAHAVNKAYADSLASGALAAAQNLADVPNKTNALANLGGSTVGRAVFTASNTATAQQQLGGSTVGRAVFTASDDASAQSAIGGSTVGRAVFVASSAAAAKAALGLSNVLSNGDVVSGDPSLSFHGGAAFLSIGTEH